MRILLVEDEHKIANSIRKGLEQEGFVVDVSYDGISGFDFAVSEEYDLIILDRLLPGMDGITICKKLREQKIHIPILMLTARSQISERVEGLNAGADDYLSKPFAFSELIARVKALSRRRGEIKGPVFKAGNLTLNSSTFEVERDGRQILLSSKEFSLLHYFLLHQGKIITKEQIINHVWNYDANVLPNSVEVYVTHLRNKIDKPFPKLSPLIQTVRGFGYKIIQ
jgi:DNA-binding response OmpR family regulator